MGKDDTQTKEIARIFERTASNAFNMQTDKIITAFETAEKTCLMLVSTKKLELEVKRRAAEWKLKLLCDGNSSFDTVDKLHKEILRLGFSSLENEGGIELYFAQYCVRQNQIDTARSVLHQLCYKLDESLKTNNLEVFHPFKGIAEQLLSNIK